MATPTPLPEHAVIQIRIESTLLDQHFINTYHYKWDADTPADDYLVELAALKDSFMQAGGMYETWLNCMSNDLVCTVINFQPVWPIRLATYGFVPTSAAGSRAPPNLPVNTAAVIERRGALANRKNVGSVHLPGTVTDSLFDPSGKWTATFMGFLDAHAEEVATDLEGTGVINKFHPVLFNLANPTETVEVVQCISSEEPRTMRRRGFRLGI
jgi:hypothetical protein